MNPAPNRPVVWGEMTGQEMMLPWFGVIVDHDASPSAIASYKPGAISFRVATPSIPVFADK